MTRKLGEDMNCMLRKFILKKINQILKEKKTSVESCKKTIDLWQSRTQLILDSVKSLSQKLDDNQLDDKEIEDFVEEVKKTIESW